MMEFQSMQKLQQQVEEQQQEQAKREQLLGLARQRRGGGMPQEQQVEQRLGVTAGQWAATAPARGLTAAQMASPSLTDSITRYAENAPPKKLWLTGAAKEPKTKAGLIDAYDRWKNWMDYDGQNYAVQRDLDRAWDEMMSFDPRYDEWWKNKKQHTVHQDIRIARHRGGKYAEAGRNLAQGKSPLARSIKKPGKTPEEVRWGHWGGGYMPDKKPVAQPQQQKVLTATNPQTGRKITSYDGGQTWQ